MEYIQGRVNLWGNIKRFTHKNTNVEVIVEGGLCYLILNEGGCGVGLVLQPRDVRDLVRVLQIPFVLLTDPVVVGLVRVQYTLMRDTNTHGVSLSVEGAGCTSDMLEGVEGIVSAFVGEDDIPGLQTALDGQERKVWNT